MDIFFEASKSKLRFESERGILSTEQLFDLPLKNGTNMCLDEMHKKLKIESRDSDVESYVDKRSNKNSKINLQISIIESIIDYKLDAISAKENAEASKAKKEKIMNILAKKEDEKLEEKSPAELKRMLKKLD